MHNHVYNRIDDFNIDITVITRYPNDICVDETHTLSAWYKKLTSISTSYAGSYQHYVDIQKAAILNEIRNHYIWVRVSEAQIMEESLKII